MKLEAFTVRVRRGRWAAVLLAGASGVAALGPVLWFTAQPAAAFAQKVNIVNFAYSPASTPIKPGDKIIWVNNSNTKHTVTSDGGAASFDYTVAPGREAELRFDTAGTYTYHCTFHSQMTGKIEVSDNPPPPPPPPPPPTTTTTPPTTATTAPPTTTTTAQATTTTAEPTTTTTAPRPAAGGVPLPPVPNSAAAPTPPLATSSTTTVPSTTTTTGAPPTTVTSAPPAPAGDATPPPPAPTPPASADKPGGDMPVAAARPAANGGKLDIEAIALVTALVAVGAFGGWTLIRVRPGRI